MDNNIRLSDKERAKKRHIRSLEQAGPERSSGPLSWWYRLAAPPEAGANASQAQQDIVRRGRLASILLLFMLIVTGAFIPSALASINRLLIPLVLSVVLICCIAIFFNRRGRVTTAGVLALSVLSLAIMLNLLTAPQGILSANGLLTYDLLVMPELVAVSLLPAPSVFLVALLNSIFIYGDITLQPHAADLEHILQASTYTVLIRPIALQFVVALVTYLWVHSAIRAIRRADRAEEVARLQRSIAEQKQELEFGIQQVQQTLVQAANGDFTVRTPLAQDNVLWQVATSLNTLLARLQRLNYSEQELQHIRAEIGRLVVVLYEAEARRLPIHTLLTGTLLDPLRKQLSGRYLFQAPAPGAQSSRR